MNIDRLAVTTNDISTFFAAESPPEHAAEDVAQRLREHGGEGLEPRARRAVQALAAADLSGA